MCRLLRCIGLLFKAVGGEATVTATKPPNVVLIFVDDLGYGDLG
ncbi:MAG: hypothetical protein RIK87_28570 [Fuerstiella sp.]